MIVFLAAGAKTEKILPGSVMVLSNGEGVFHLHLREDEETTGWGGGKTQRGIICGQDSHLQRSCKF